MIGLNNARFQWLDLWPFLHSHYRNFIGSTTAFQQQFICLFSSSDSFLRKLLPFLVPIILSLHIPLGLHYEPVSLPVPVTQHGRSEGKFLLNHTDCALTHPYISIWSSFRTVPSQIRQSARQSRHSNHRYFIDTRPIGNTIHLWTAFGNFIGKLLRLLSVFVVGLHTISFTETACPPSVSVSGRYPIIPLIKLSVHNHIFTIVRRLFTAYEQVALSQNGSELCAPFGVVFRIRLLMSFSTSLSSRT